MLAQGLGPAAIHGYLEDALARFGKRWSGERRSRGSVANARPGTEAPRGRFDRGNVCGGNGLPRQPGVHFAHPGASLRFEQLRDGARRLRVRLLVRDARAAQHVRNPAGRHSGNVRSCLRPPHGGAGLRELQLRTAQDGCGGTLNSGACGAPGALDVPAERAAGPGEPDDAFPLRDRLRLRDNFGFVLQCLRMGGAAFASLDRGPGRSSSPSPRISSSTPRRGPARTPSRGSSAARPAPFAPTSPRSSTAGSSCFAEIRRVFVVNRASTNTRLAREAETELRKGRRAGRRRPPAHRVP